MPAILYHKEPAQAVGDFGCDYIAGSLLHKIAGASNTLKLSTNESRASLELDQ